MKTIQLGKGYFTKVDDDDYEKCAAYTWGLSRNKNKSYVAVTRKKRIGDKTITIYLAREIIGALRGECVDHINGDTLDNRKSNLRLCTRAENSRNCGLRKNNKSGYKGVFLVVSNNKWRAYITINYKSIFLGHFKNKKVAAEAYNKAAIKYFGNFAKLNNI